MLHLTGSEGFLVHGSLVTARSSAEEEGGDVWSNLQGVTFGMSV